MQPESTVSTKILFEKIRQSKQLKPNNINVVRINHDSMRSRFTIESSAVFKVATCTPSVFSTIPFVSIRRTKLVVLGAGCNRRLGFTGLPVNLRLLA